MDMRLQIWALYLLSASPICAWDGHALLTRFAIRAMPQVVQAAPVKVESLDAFIAAEPVALTRVLAEEEAWSLKNVPGYPMRPARFAYSYKDGAKDLRARFLKAIRVNPNTKFALALQGVPGNNQPQMPPQRVTLMPSSLAKNCTFVELQPGQMVSPLEVFASATDEPDYGLDTKLWSDNGSTFGRSSNFGEQPFGNTKLEFGTQAPFHMGLFHEGSLTNWAAGDRLRTFPEHRIHLFYSLSRMAFQTGHPYWGWRFAGMGAHYIQDLTQPYHTKILPGESTFSFLWSGLLDMLGFSDSKNKYLEQATTEHQQIEKLVYVAVLKAIQTGFEADPLVRALQQIDPEYQLYSPTYVREKLAAQSYELADPVAKAMRSDPKSATTAALLSGLMKHFGQHTRGFIRAILPPINSQKQRIMG